MRWSHVVKTFEQVMDLLCAMIALPMLASPSDGHCSCLSDLREPGLPVKQQRWSITDRNRYTIDFKGVLSDAHARFSPATCSSRT